MTFFHLPRRAPIFSSLYLQFPLSSVASIFSSLYLQFPLPSVPSTVSSLCRHSLLPSLPSKSVSPGFQETISPFARSNPPQNGCGRVVMGGKGPVLNRLGSRKLEGAEGISSLLGREDRYGNRPEIRLVFRQAQNSHFSHLEEFGHTGWIRQP